MLVVHSLKSLTREKGLMQFFSGCGVDPEVEQSSGRAEYQKRWGEIVKGKKGREENSIEKWGARKPTSPECCAEPNHLPGAEGSCLYFLVLSCQVMEPSPCLSIEMHPCHPGIGILGLHLLYNGCTMLYNGYKGWRKRGHRGNYHSLNLTTKNLERSNLE